MEPDADGERLSLPSPRIPVLLLHARLETERCQHGPLGVILLRDGHPKEGQEAVLSKVLVRALLAWNGSLGTGEPLLPPGIPGLGLQGRRQRRGVGQAAGQDRRQLALPVQRGATAWCNAGGEAGGSSAP